MEGAAAAAADLQKAAAEGDLERVQRLLAAGSDACEGNVDGMTPLMLAAQNGHAEVVRALIQAGAPWNALNPAGQCAGDFAMEAGHQEAFDVLLDAGKLALYAIFLLPLQRAIDSCQQCRISRKYCQLVSWEFLGFIGP